MAGPWSNSLRLIWAVRKVTWNFSGPRSINSVVLEIAKAVQRSIWRRKKTHWQFLAEDWSTAPLTVTSTVYPDATGPCRSLGPPGRLFAIAFHCSYHCNSPPRKSMHGKQGTWFVSWDMCSAMRAFHQGIAVGGGLLYFGFSESSDRVCGVQGSDVRIRYVCLTRGAACYAADFVQMPSVLAHLLVLPTRSRQMQARIGFFWYWLKVIWSRLLCAAPTFQSLKWGIVDRVFTLFLLMKQWQYTKMCMHST